MKKTVHVAAAVKQEVVDLCKIQQLRPDVCKTEISLFNRVKLTHNNSVRNPLKSASSKVD